VWSITKVNPKFAKPARKRLIAFAEQFARECVPELRKPETFSLEEIGLMAGEKQCIRKAKTNITNKAKELK